MPRYISEYNFSTAGGKIQVPTCAKFLGISKIANQFVLVAEVWGNPNRVYEIDVRVFHKDEYVMPESIYLGHCVAGTVIYHFSYTHGEVEDLGGDGGTPPDVDDEGFEEDKPEPKVLDYVKPAGGMTEC